MQVLSFFGLAQEINLDPKSVLPGLANTSLQWMTVLNAIKMQQFFCMIWGNEFKDFRRHSCWIQYCKHSCPLTHTYTHLPSIIAALKTVTLSVIMRLVRRVLPPPKHALPAVLRKLRRLARKS